MEWIGTIVDGRYEVQSQLGEGGMGSVWLAKDLRLERKVVVKVPHADLLSDPQFRARFLSEVRGMSRLEHLHVIKIHDAGEHEGVPFMVVQFVGGGDLRDRIPRGERQPVEEILRWVRPVADALDFCHEKNFVHRDVKPGNILFDRSGNPYLSDFGIATVMRNVDDTGADAQLTQFGVFVGSPVYSPPEALDRALSPQYDQYSLAVVVYEALCGAFPYEVRSGTQVMNAKVREDPRPLLEQAPDVRPAVAEVVMRALSREASARFTSCRAFVEALAEAVALGPETSAAPLPSAEATVIGPAGGEDPVAAATGPGRGRLLAIAGGAALLVAGLAWVLLRSPEAPAEAPPATTVTQPEANLPEGSEPPLAVGDRDPRSFRGGATAEQLAYARSICEPACDPAVFESEGRRSAVALSPFSMSLHEVTAAEFARFVEATGHTTTAERTGASAHGFTALGPVRAPGASWRAPDGPGSDWRAHPDQPAVHLAAADAEAYCAHQGGRLPTEDEWEFVARGGAAHVFPWGDEWDPEAAIWGGSRQDPPSVGLRDVGSEPGGVGAFGHTDLAGSVWEWTSTRGGEGRILKGGSWLETNPAFLRTTVQLELDPNETQSDVGFRCVSDAETWPR